MKHLSSIVLAVALIAAGATACFKDPTSSLRNGPDRLVLTRSTLFLNVGDSLSVQAEVKDAQGNTFDAGDAVWSTDNVAIAVVRRDSTVNIPFNAFSKAFIRAVAAGQTWVRITTRGLTDSIQVYGLPLVFDGTVAVKANPTIWDTLTINASSALTFNTAAGSKSSVYVTVAGADYDLTTLSLTASQLRVLVPAYANMAVKVRNVILSGVVNIARLPTTVTALTGTGVNEPGNDALATATSITIPATATAAAPYTVDGWMTGSDVTDYYTFTLSSAAAVHVVLAWFGDGSGADTGNPDLDVVICGPSPVACSYGTDLIPGNGASSAVQPESGTTPTLVAGTYAIRVYGYSTPSSGMRYTLKLNLQ